MAPAPHPFLATPDFAAVFGLVRAAGGAIDARVVASESVQAGDLENYSCVVLVDAFPLPGELLPAWPCVATRLP